MKRGILQVAGVLTAVLVAGAIAAGDSGELKAALKQVNKATKGIRSVVAEVEYAETVGERSLKGSGKLWISFEGLIRGEVADKRTFIFIPPYLQVYSPDDGIVEMYDVTRNRHMLGQYLLLGFAPIGSAMKDEFDVQRIPNDELDGRPALSFLIKPKDKVAAGALSRIQLWVDPESGLPLKHEILHAQSDTRLTVRYIDIVPSDEELSGALFQADWPEGTTTVRK